VVQTIEVCGEKVQVETHRTSLKTRQGSYATEVLGFDGESSLVVIATRQDGKTSYIIVKTAVDDVTSIKVRGLCKSKDFKEIVKKAIEERFA